MTVGVPDPYLWRRVSTLEKQIASLEGLLRRMSLTRHITPLNARLWMYQDGETAGSDDLYDIDATDTKLDIPDVESPGLLLCLEQIDLKGKRHFIAVSGGGNAVATTDTIIPGREGNVPGGPISVQKKKIVDPDASPLAFEDDGDPVACYSWVKADSGDPADEEGDVLWIFIEQDSHGQWWFTGEDCPPVVT